MKNTKVGITLFYLAGLFFGAGFFYSYIYKNSISQIIRLSPGSTGFTLEPYILYIVLACVWVFLAILLILFNKYQNKKEKELEEDDEE